MQQTFLQALLQLKKSVPAVFHLAHTALANSDGHRKAFSTHSLQVGANASQPYYYRPLLPVLNSSSWHHAK